MKKRWLLLTCVTVALAGGLIGAAMLSKSPDTPAAPSQDSPAGPEDILCGEYSSFSGKFVEDRTDTPVTDVAAMLVTNRSGQYLDLATLTYLVDGNPATFVVTGLPPGKSAWVLEQNGLTAGPDSVFQRQDCTASFRDYGGFSREISLTSRDHDLTATNTTDRTLKDVYVYYKALHTDGNFFGGITYRVGFGDLAPGASKESIAGHYSSGNAQVVRVTWQEEGE